ncbi:hypothetical protein F4779DRAFT_629858 [Xylariaceae sp. FL0662B]|nr:hypothetical protein F4779DRAFT_629858 [Xylariaceae sp. FL0662B]
MPDAPRLPSKPASRFVPVPIETTFDSYRVNNTKGYPHGPTAELTPDPSPTTPQAPTIIGEEEPEEIQSKQSKQPEKKDKRRFAPQLIETTRRSKRAGQDGPATKPIDKTDITPGTNHIYAPKPKRKPVPRPSGAGPGSGTGEDEEESPSRFLTPHRQQSIKPHPNTRRQTRSYTPDLDTILSSDSDSSSGNSSEEEVLALDIGVPALNDANIDEDEDAKSWTSRHYDLRNRRESCDEEFSGYLLAVAAREAHRQREVEQAMAAFPNGVRPEGVEHFVVRDNSEDEQQLDETSRHGPSQLLRRKSTDPGWAVREMRAHAEKLAQRRDQMSIDENVDQLEMLPPPEDPLWTTNARRESPDQVMTDDRDSYADRPTPPLLSRVDTRSPAQDNPFSPPQPEAGLRASPFGIPFGGIRINEPEDPVMLKMRMAASPPMLGGDLKFRICPSPQQTRMETDHRYCPTGRPVEKQRDVTEGTGLWRGYCSARARDADEMVHPGPNLLMTPREPSTPHDPFSAAFTASMSISSVMSGTDTSGTVSPASRQSQQKGLYMLSSVDERLKKEKARKELEERIAAEFDDAFVTQVYNYLSLGYPAMARDFDDELSKISGIEIEQLRKDDTQKIDKGFMLQMEMSIHKSDHAPGHGGPPTDTSSISTGNSSSSTGNSTATSSGAVSSGDDTEMLEPEEYERRRRHSHRRHKPPRWIALKLYIREWARQHPKLNDAESGPMAWGVRARRGSWAI